MFSSPREEGRLAVLVSVVAVSQEVWGEGSRSPGECELLLPSDGEEMSRSQPSHDLGVVSNRSGVVDDDRVSSMFTSVIVLSRDEF